MSPSTTPSVASEAQRQRFPELSYVETVAEVVRDADAVIVLTEWPREALA